VVASWACLCDQLHLWAGGPLSSGSVTALHAWAFDALGLFVVLSLALNALGSARRKLAPQPDAEPSGDEFLLWLWLLAVACFAALAAPFVAVRHLLPGLPALVFL